MNKLSRISKAVVKSGLYSFIFFLPMFGAACSSAPSGVTGIRVKAVSSTLTAFGPIQLPVPNCPNNGTWGSDLVTPNPHTGAKAFLGRTDARGISDYPGVQTDSRWRVTVGKTFSPPCAANTFFEDVPFPGSVFNYICLL